jgi:DNA-binding beta-propeller fold protein YncE
VGALITLESPSGKTARVFDRIEVAVDGEWRINMSSTFGYDEAPSEGLWQFKGESTRGLWKLNVSAIYTYGEWCTLHSWSLHFFRYRHKDIQRIVFAESYFRNHLMAFDEDTGEQLYRARLRSQYGLYDGNYPISVAVSRDQKYVYAACYSDINLTTWSYDDSTISVFEMMTGKFIKYIRMNGSSRIDSVEAAVKADRVVGVTSHYLYVINTTTNQIEGELQLPGFTEDSETYLGVAPNGSLAYIANQGDEYIQIVDLDTLSPSGQIPLPGIEILDIDISLDGSFGIITSWDTLQHRFDTATHTVTEILSSAISVSQGVIIPDGTKTFYAQYQWYEGISTINLTSMVKNKHMPHPEATTWGIAASWDNKIYVGDYSLSRIWIYDAITENKLGEIDTLDGETCGGVDYGDVVGKVSDISATAGDGFVELRWTPPHSRGTSIIGHKIYRVNASFHEEYYISTENTSFIDLNVVNGETYYYRISAVNGAGEGGLSNEVSATPEAESMFLSYGWNLISIPKIQSDTSLDSVLSSIQGSYDEVRYFSAQDILDPWKHNHTSKPLEMNDLDDLDHTMGFWIHVTEPTGVLFTYSGSEPLTSQDIQLRKGWNMVGFPSPSFHNRTNGLNNTVFGSQIRKVMWYDPTYGSWYNMAEGDLFIFGRGYWIYSNEDVIWSVPI